MAVGYQLSLFSANGDWLVGALDFLSIDITLVEKDIGTMTVTLFPYYADSLFQRDGRLALQRSVDGLPYAIVGDALWLITSRSRSVDPWGETRIILEAAHPNHILKRRVVAYTEDTANATKSDLASDVMKAFIDENFVSATDSSRNLSSSYFVRDTVGIAFGATISINGSYRPVFDLLQEICASSAAQGVYAGFEVYSPTFGGLTAQPYHCRLYSTLRGVDRGFSSGNLLLVRPGDLGAGAMTVIEDWFDIASYVYVGGAGKHNELVVSTASDATLIAQSPFGRHEAFDSATSADTAVLSSEASRVLRELRPMRTFETDITSPTDDAFLKFGRDYNWGDIIGMQFWAPVINAQTNNVTAWIELQFSCRVDPVHIVIERPFDEAAGYLNPQERVEIHLRSVQSVG